MNVIGYAEKDSTDRGMGWMATRNYAIQMLMRTHDWKDSYVHMWLRIPVHSLE